MKKLLLVMAFVFVSFCGALQAQANPTATCLCAGREGQESAGCGFGAVGGNKGQWLTIKSKDIGKYIKDSSLLLQFSMGYHVQDPVTGWYCVDKATW